MNKTELNIHGSLSITGHRYIAQFLRSESHKLHRSVLKKTKLLHNFKDVIGPCTIHINTELVVSETEINQ